MSAALQPVSDAAGGALMAHRLLLIEGEADQSIYWSSLLSSLGFSVTCANSLAQAHELLTLQPGLIVCAAHLDDGRGSDFFATLRGREEFARVYLILLTSSFGQEELIESLSFGANDCMDKGASYGEVRARLELAGRVITLNEALHEKSNHLSHALGLLRSELESAARLQAAMLPQRLEAAGVRIDVLYRPSDMLGGDMLGIVPLPGGRRVAFGLIDVVGHGTASALISCSLMRELMDRMVAVLEAGCDPRRCGQQVIEEMNARYCRLGIPGMYFTALAGVLDPEGGQLSYCQAGHPSLYHFDAVVGWRVLEEAGFPVGLFEDSSFASIDLPLHSGERVLMVSDGLLRPSEADPVGSDAVLSSLCQLGANADRILARLEELAAQSVGEERDDQSAMLISLQRPGAPS
jgi:sigma-B regulation protein RsbU (phosphoserine phosphatase)